MISLSKKDECGMDVDCAVHAELLNSPYLMLALLPQTLLEITKTLQGKIITNVSKNKGN